MQYRMVEKKWGEATFTGSWYEVSDGLKDFVSADHAGNAIYVEFRERPPLKVGDKVAEGDLEDLPSYSLVGSPRGWDAWQKRGSTWHAVGREATFAPYFHYYGDTTLLMLPENSDGSTYGDA